jgi:hypothetical protein
MVAAVRFTALLAAVVLSAPAAAIDPTAPPLPAAGAHAGLGNGPAPLAWVRVDGRDSVAWYDGTIARLGDRVSGGRLLAIHEDHIVLAGPKGTRRVYLLDPALRANH